MAAIAQGASPVRLVRTAEANDELAEIRDAWDAFSWPRVDADLDFVAELVTATPEAVRPHIAALANADGPQAMLVGRIEETRLVTRIGYRTVLRPRVRMLTIAPGGLAAGVGQAEALVAEITRTLRRSRADVAVLPSLHVGSPLYSAARNLPGWLSRDRVVDVRAHRRLELPPSFDEFLAARSKSTRESIKRYSKKLERDFTGRLSFALYDDPAAIDELFAAVDPVAQKTYQQGLGVALRDDERNRRLVAFGLGRGWFRVWVLSIDGVPVAFWPGWLYNRSFFIGTPGYDPALSDYRLGQYVLMRLIEDLCADAAVDFCDFGAGDSEYKRRFSTESWAEADVLVFAPSLRGVRLNVTRTCVSYAARALRFAASHAGVEDRLKRLWRRRLAA